MFARVNNFIDTGGLRLSNITENRYILFYVLSLITLLYSVSGILIGTSLFSPDSWAYFELSKTVFSGEFYKFNTYRGYFSDEYSSSFPLGYPVILAITHLFFGQKPVLAIALNIGAAIATGYIIYAIAKRLNLSVFTGIVLSCSLLLYPYYYEEVIYGCTMPFAILFFVLAFSAYLKNHFIWTGVLLGMSALVRFDFLVFGILFQIAIFFLDRRQSSKLPVMAFGFILGVLPWVIYSVTYFGKVWVSDNSWVVLSALPAYVRDFPAAVTISVFDNPAMWITRVAGNLFAFLKSFLRSVTQYPVTILFLYLMVANRHQLAEIDKYRVKIFLLILCASIMPYLLTGYFDKRYYALLLLCCGVFMVFTLVKVNARVATMFDFNRWLFLSLIFAVAIGVNKVVIISWESISQSDEWRSETQQIKHLKRCHDLRPELTYIFMPNLIDLAPRYGALTGMRTASTPSNFEAMSDQQKALYFEHLKPYRKIDKLTGAKKCSNQ